MSFIFSNLPDDIKNHILSFDKHFKIRRGQLVSVISKDDFRYNILYYSINHLINSHQKNEHQINFRYNLHNLYNIDRGEEVQNDMIIVLMNLSSLVIKYDIFIGRFIPKTNNMNNMNNMNKLHSIEDCQWNFFNYYYDRF